MEYYVVHVVKAEFNESANDIFLLGVFDENSVKGKLREYIHNERWEASEASITDCIDRIISNDVNFYFNECGTIYTFEVQKIKLNKIEETFVMCYDS